MPKFVIRTASIMKWQEELIKIQDFYAENRHSGNAIRDPEVLIKSISDNKAYLVEDAESNALQAVSFCFSINDGDFTEFGGTRVKAEGYGLQKLLTYLRAMNEFRMDSPKYEAYTIIANWNTKSRNGIERSGFEAWNPTEELLRHISFNSKSEKSFFRLPTTQLSSMRDNLLAISNRGYLVHRENSDRVEIEIRMKLITEGRLTPDYDFLQS